MSPPLVFALAAILVAPLSAQADQLVLLQHIHGTVVIDLGNDGQTILVAVDESKGGEAPDGAADYVFTLDLAGKLLSSPVRRFERAEVAYVLGECRLQVYAEADGENLIFAPSPRPLMQLTGSAVELPIVHYATENLGIYQGWDDTPIEAAIDILRDSKKVILEALTRQADRPKPKVIAGTKPARQEH